MDRPVALSNDGQVRSAPHKPGSLSFLLNNNDADNNNTPTSLAISAASPVPSPSLSSSSSSSAAPNLPVPTRNRPVVPPPIKIDPPGCQIPQPLSANFKTFLESPLVSPSDLSSPTDGRPGSRATSKAGRGRPRLYQSQKLQDFATGEPPASDRSPPHALYRDQDDSSNPENLDAALLTRLQQADDGEGQRQIANPFSELFTSQTALAFRKEVSSVMHHWTAAHKLEGRKLVYFWRSSSSREIFHSSLVEPKGVKSVVVSCIYWNRLDDYFFTSVDCLQLLEKLIGRKFNSEQKNRIRRNLEG